MDYNLPYEHGAWFIHPKTGKMYEFGYDSDVSAMRWFEVDPPCSNPDGKEIEAPAPGVLETSYLDTGEGWFPVKETRDEIPGSY